MPNITQPSDKTFNNFRTVVQRGDGLVRAIPVDSNLTVVDQFDPDYRYNGRNLVELQFDQLSEPETVRPIHRDVHGDRAQYTDPRTRISVTRPRKVYQALAQQPPIYASPAINEYFNAQDHPIARGVSEDQDRGKPKNTIYGKKRPCTSINYEFKFTPFRNFRSVGFTFDDALVHKKGDRYCWEDNAYTNGGGWVGSG